MIQYRYAAKAGTVGGEIKWADQPAITSSNQQQQPQHPRKQERESDGNLTKSLSP